MIEQEEDKEHKPLFTFTHVLLLSIFITIISLNKVNEIGKNSLETSKKLAQIERQFLRNLDFKDDTDSVCKKADEKLQKYYQTGDKSLIGLSNSTRQQSTASYIKALTDIISNQAGGSGTNETEGSESDNDDSGASSDVTTNLKKYLMHVIPVLAFFVIAILSIPGWVVCCSCCCCNCCCCCCCKRPICRFPFFIVTMAFDAIVVISCIYGLAQSNKVFVGFANLECSLMQFIREVTDGQTKTDNTTATWIGIDGIRQLLNNVKLTVAQLRVNTNTNLTNEESNLNVTKNTFLSAKTNFTTDFYPCPSDTEISDSGKKYCLSTYKIIGKENSNNANSFNKMLETEYQLKVEQAGSYISDTITNFQSVLNNGSSGNAIETILDDAMDKIDTIQNPINNVKDMVAGYIVDYSTMIDEKGKLGFKLVYAVLTIVVAVNAALVVVYFVFGTSLCLKCRILRCLNKLFIHIFWNISALLMIITFIVGAILTLVGTLGQDLVSVVSFLIGPDNLNAASPALIGSAADYLKPCLIGNGDLAKTLNLDNSSATSSINELQNLTTKINQVYVQFESIKNSEAMKRYRDEIDKNIDVKSSIIFQSNVFLCPNDPPNNDKEISEFSPNDFKYYQDETTSTETNTDIETKIRKIQEDRENNVGLVGKLNSLNESYSDLVNAELRILTVFKETISSITSLFTPFIGTNGSIFNFLNCKFIGNNLDIILKYLKEAIGSNIYSVGVFLLVAGCSMIFSIIFTILEVIIINAAVDDKLKNPISAVSKFV